MDSLATLRLGDYLARLASGDAVPGGGAAAAVTGAQAAALLSMVVAITAKEAKPTPPDVTSLQADLNAMRTRLLDLATKDGEAFGAVMATYKMPNVTDAEKAARKAAMQAALKDATEVPLTLMKALADLLPKIEKVATMAKPTVASDAAIAVELWATALSTARYNVRINLKYLKDESFIRDASERAQSFAAHHAERRDAILLQLDAMLT